MNNLQISRAHCRLGVRHKIIRGPTLRGIDDILKK